MNRVAAHLKFMNAAAETRPTLQPITHARTIARLACVTPDGRLLLRAHAVMVFIGSYTLMSSRKIRAQLYQRPGTFEVIAWE